jgi:hypothetical protein
LVAVLALIRARVLVVRIAGRLCGRLVRRGAVAGTGSHAIRACAADRALAVPDHIALVDGGREVAERGEDYLVVDSVLEPNADEVVDPVGAFPNHGLFVEQVA